jgi:hypothetical protein
MSLSPWFSVRLGAASCLLAGLASAQVPPGAVPLTPIYDGGYDPFTLIEVIDFEDLPAGTIVDQVFGSRGTGPVTINGTIPGKPGNRAVIFDSSNPTGNDFDLGSPNQDFGGPGVGDGGAAGSPFANDQALGNVLILAEDLVDNDGDGLVDDPDDDDVVGSTWTFDFGDVGDVTIFSFQILDVENDELVATIEFIDQGGATIETLFMPIPGDNGLATGEVGGLSGVRGLLITLNGSGCLGGIEFARDNSGIVGDTVWCDENDDGVQDAGEPGIEGATVELFCFGADGILGTADDLSATTTTDANGNYLFEEVPQGICRVTVDPASVGDKQLGKCPESLTLMLELGEEYLDADFCFVTPGQVGDLVWCDLDDDGVLDDGEPGLPGILVTLICAGPDGIQGTEDDFVDSQVTDADGMYLFTDVPPGLCRVFVDPSTAPADKTLGQCPQVLVFDLAPDQAFLDGDFCFITPGEIGDTVFCDLDDDGVLDDGEPGIEGVLVSLQCAGLDGEFDTADDIFDAQLTDADGMYLFELLPEGTCLVTVDVDSAPLDKVLGQCPTEYVVELAPLGSFLDADFCFVTPGEIGDFVWCDVDDDGVQDDGEPGIAGVIVDLRCAGIDGVFGTQDDYGDSTTTDENGEYLFTNVAPGLCQVIVNPDSAPFDKVLGQCPTLVELVLAPDDAFLAADFCFITIPGRVEGTVFCDLDDDGVQDDGEDGIAGALVTLTCAGVDGLLGTADDVSSETESNSLGNYFFLDVPPGLCEVSIDVGSVPPDKILGKCRDEVAFLVHPGESVSDIDFCFGPAAPASVGDLVWCDTDQDGLFDVGEPGIDGILVTLICAGPDQELRTQDDVVFTQITGVGGHYLFTDVPAGLCAVEFPTSGLPDGKQLGLCDSEIEFELVPGESFLDADYCLELIPGRVQGQVFCDLDDDGFHDPGEPGIPNVLVHLLCAGVDGEFGTSDDIMDSLFTDAGGEYFFPAVQPGECLVSIDPSTFPEDKVLGSCGTELEVNLEPGQAVREADFCFVEPSTVGDLVWCDLDGDRRVDEGEPGVEGVVIVLTGAGLDGELGTADDYVATATTDANGAYLFTMVPPDATFVEVDQSTLPKKKQLGPCGARGFTLSLRPGRPYYGADFCLVK